MNTSFTREDIVAASGRAVIAFVRTFGRHPTQKEFAMIVSAIWRHFDNPDASLQ